MNVFARIWLERKAKVPAFSSYITEKELEDLRASRTAESQNDEEACTAEDMKQNENSTTTTSTNENDKDSVATEEPDIAPEEEIGAEKETVSKTIIEEMGEAAMGTQSNIVKPSATNVDFGFFVANEPEKVMPNPGFYQPVTPDSYMAYGQVQQAMRPQFMGQQPQIQFEQYPGANNPMMQQPMNPQQQAAAAQQAANIPGKGRHKVDNPPKPKPEVKKAAPENVEVDLDLMVKPDMKEPTVRKVPDVVQEIPAAEAAPTPEAKFDNTELTKEFKYLEEIERVARECGAQVKYEMRPGSNGKPSGLITCLTYAGNINRPNPFKSFTIDTGKIIDRRAKILIGDPTTMAYEDMAMYLISINPKNNDEKAKNKDGNIFNEKLFKDIFTGGVQMLEPSKLYTRDYLELNKYVSLITMPTSNMNSESRKAVRDRLLKALKEGVFKKALASDPKARFRFEPGCYDKKTMAFKLTTTGTPYRFCGPCLASKKIELNFGADGKTSLSEGN